MRKSINHIVFITPVYLPAQLTGSEVVVKELAGELVRKGYRVTLLTSDAIDGRYWYDPIFGKKAHKKKEIIDGVTVIRLQCRQILSSFLFLFNILVQKFFKSFFFCRGLADSVEILSWGPLLDGMEREIKKLHPDVVLVSPFPAGICLTGRLICKKWHIPYAVIPFFKKDQKLFYNTLLSKILDDACIIFTPTQTERDYIRQYTKNEHIKLLPSALDRKYIQSNQKQIEQKARILQKTLLGKFKKIVLFVGNKGIGKGVIDAAEAVHNLGRDDVLFVALGNNTRQWNTYVKTHSYACVRDIAYQTGIIKYAYFMIADVIVLPSVSDNFPIVFLESWEYKKPVVAYDYYAMKELLEDGSGSLATCKDIDDLTAKIKDLLDNPKKCRAIGAVGFRKNKQYAIQNVTANFIKDLEKAIVV